MNEPCEHHALSPLDRLEPRAVRMALIAEPLPGPDACPLR